MDDSNRLAYTQSLPDEALKMKPMIRNKEGAREASYTHKPPIRAGSLSRGGDEKKKKSDFNIAEKFLNSEKIKEEEQQTAARLKMKMINDEMRDMLMMAQDTSGAIKEMNEAFSGEQEFDYITTVTKGNKTKVRKVRR